MVLLVYALITRVFAFVSLSFEPCVSRGVVFLHRCRRRRHHARLSILRLILISSKRMMMIQCSSATLPLM
uniref:Putative secreted peptide n=1 Tax=Anopheles braziliensis TaxID=58242 RepID=A0A2M3ZTG0_9DIPT